MTNNLDSILKDAASKGFSKEEIDQVSYYWADKYNDYQIRHVHTISHLNKGEYLDVARDYATAATKLYISRTIDGWHDKLGDTL